MGFRYFKRVRILPGLRVNLSRSGASVSVGRRGAWWTVGHGKSRTTVGLPGTGVSYTHIEGAPTAPAAAPGGARPRIGKILFWICAVSAVLVALAVLTNR